MASCVVVSANTLAPANVASPCFGQNSGVQARQLDGLRCDVQGVPRHGVRPSDANGDIGVTLRTENVCGTDSLSSSNKVCDSV